MGFKLNLTAQEVKDAQGGFTPIPEGIYAATIFDAKTAVSKAGNDMYVLDFLITDGPEVRKNFKLKSWFTVKANALFSLIALHKAIDFPYPNPKELAEGGEFEFPDADEYLNHQVLIKVVLDPYMGENDEGETVKMFRNSIKTVLKYDESKITSAEDAEAPASDDLFL